MNEKPVKKVNVAYLLATILIPIVLIAALGFVGYTFFRDGGNGAVICFMAPTLLSIAWWILGPTFIWRSAKKKMTQQLDEQGFTRNHTFYGSNQTVSVDLNQGKIALLLFWNPSKLYVLPASRVTRAWTEDGAGGSGILRGTSRVRFGFLVDDVTVKVNTFTSNQRWKLDDPKILEAISKADMMVKVLGVAKERAGG